MSEPVALEDNSEASRPALLRVKRKRGEAAVDEIILQDVTSTAPHHSKRTRMDELLLQQFSAVSLTASGVAAVDKPKRMRFIRVQTLQAQDLKGKTAEELKALIASWAQQQPPTATPSGRPSGSERQAPKAAASSSSASHLQGLRQAAQEVQRAARYKQVRNRRMRDVAPSNDSKQQPNEDDSGKALQDLFQLYDVEVEESSGKDQASGVPSTSAAAAGKGPKAKGSGKPPPDEAAIMMHYLPMVQQFLQDSGVAPADPSSSRTTPSADSRGPDAGCVNDEGTAYVYDMYIPMDEDWSEDTSEAFAPVIDVVDPDDEFYWSADPENSDHDSEDSNAESYYANSYPDEEDDHDSSSDADDTDKWMRGKPTWGVRADDEEYDVPAYEEEEEEREARKKAQSTKGSRYYRNALLGPY